MSSLNIIKKYPELLELAYLSEREREHDLHAIFKRDIEDNCQFSFRGWRIYPIKTDGEIDMARLFKHLTCEEIMVENEDGTTYPKRVFEMARSQRLHWINHHVRELTPDNLDVFTIEERDGKKRKVKKTYIYDKVEKYVIVLEQQRSNGGSPDKSGGKFFNSIENLHLCTMNNQGLLALAQLILPSEILSNFEVVRVEEEASLIRIYLDESVKAEYKENPEIESKGFCEAVTIRDFPIRDKGVDLIVRRRKWYDKQNNRYFSDSYDLKAEETRYSKEFAAFLKGVYGDDSYDLPFA